ncbi:prephenate dehydratase [soil metagenome]
MTSPPPARLVVAFAGDPGSFAEDAAVTAFPGASTQAVPMFADVAQAVTGGEARVGVLPIENVVGGTVREVLDLLLASDVVIVGEVIVPVRLCLAALPGQAIEGIERVYSHIQALGQAEVFLRTRPWSLLASTNTAGSGRMIRERGERGSAAVLSPRAAELFGLTILADDIQSEPRNRTRFLVIAAPGPDGARAPVAGSVRGSAPRSTLALSVRNEPGTLHGVLAVIASHGLNMSKLESRPSRQGTWEYVFWVDLDADICGAPGEGERGAFLADLRAVCVWVRVMGCYARGAEPPG